ncbi:MAG: hypothetical protein CL608_24505 [Anaerolineaceae bacterium]|nr:hypothetical protein [Anaerolineaceae bacterium]
MPIITLLILLLMFITPIISVMTVMLRFSEIKRTANWPQITGEVTDVRLLQTGKEYQPSLDIAYTVDSQAYNSRLHPVSKTGQAKGSKKWAREFSLQFKPGTAVPVYYDPSRPKRATLHPQQMGVNDSRLQITSGIMILLSVGIHLLGARGLIGTYLNLTGSSVMVTMFISTLVTVLLGAAFGLLIQEMRQVRT